VVTRYRFFKDGRWRLLLNPERWTPELWARISGILEDQPPSSHPRTTRFRYPDADGGEEFYLKIHYPLGALDKFKNFFRFSKAVRALKQREALAQNGFHAPIVIAAGEERFFGRLEKAFLLTVGLQGSTVPVFLKHDFGGHLDGASLKLKRDYLRELATEVGRFHRLGFVHGDLTPHNLFVQTGKSGLALFFMDNDRTRRYPTWLPQRLWKRNLVQLNRFILPGITLQDRMRFLGAYLGKSFPRSRKRRLVRWLEWNTRRRWLERGAKASQVSFRELLRWNGPFSTGF
jgi:hypothetical protein